MKRISSLFVAVLMAVGLSIAISPTSASAATYRWVAIKDTVIYRDAPVGRQIVIRNAMQIARDSNGRDYAVRGYSTITCWNGIRRQPCSVSLHAHGVYQAFLHQYKVKANISTSNTGTDGWQAFYTPWHTMQYCYGAGDSFYNVTGPATYGIAGKYVALGQTTSYRYYPPCWT